MRVIWIAPDGAEHVIDPTPREDEPDVLALGPCPACGAAEHRVRGTGQSIAPDDRAYIATARSVCCGAAAGTLRAEPGTLFGLTEDHAVLTFGRARVYGADLPRAR